MDTQDD